MKWDEMTRLVERAVTPDEVRDVVFRYRGKSYETLAQVGERARAWDEGLLLAVLATGSGAYQILKNPHLPEWAFPRIAQWELNRLHAEAARDPVEQAVTVLKQMSALGRLPVGSAEFQEMLDIVMPKGKRRQTSLARRQEGALRVLLAHPDLPEPLFFQLWERLQSALAEHDWIPVLLHPRCPDALRETLLLDHLKSPSHEVLHRLVEEDSLRLDPRFRPRIRDWVRNVGLVKLWTPFIRDAREEDAREFWLALRTLNIQAAVTVLIEHGERVVPLLERDDLAPLFNHPSQAVRLAAIQASGFLAAGGVAQARGEGRG